MQAPSDFFALLPRRSTLVFLLAVFFTFSPVSLLMASSLAEERPLLSILASCVISGCLAISWAASFTISRWYIIGIITFSVLTYLHAGPLRRTWFGIQTGRPSFEGLGIVLAVVMGYVLFVMFINGQGRTTLRLKTEMELAAQIHDTLVPPLRSDIDRYEILACSVASSEMGGDLVDMVSHGKGTDLVLADVSGHGVRAGVVMAMLKSGIRTCLQTPGPLSSLLTRLNRLLEETTTSEIYATFAGLRLPGGNHNEVEYALAGHKLLHIQAGTGHLRRLDGQSIPLGMVPQECSADSLKLGAGDLLAVYTDGLNETENAAGEQLDNGPIESVLRESAGRPLEEIQQAVFALAVSHGKQEDDRSLLLIRARS